MRRTKPDVVTSLTFPARFLSLSAFYLSPFSVYGPLSLSPKHNVSYTLCRCACGASLSSHRPTRTLVVEEAPDPTLEPQHKQAKPEQHHQVETCQRVRVSKSASRPRPQDTLPHERVRRAFESCLSGRSRVSLCAAESRTRAGTEHGPRPTRARLRSGKGARRWRGIPDMAMAVPASACIPHMSSMSSRLHSLRTQRSPARLSKKAGRKRLQGTLVYLSGPDVSKIQNTGIAHSQSKSRPN